MKLLTTLLLLLVVAGVQPVCAQKTTSLLPVQPGTGGVSEGSGTSFVTLPEGQAGAPGVQKARELIDQMIQALGGRAWMDVQDMEQQGRTYSFDHGEPTGAGAPYWRFWKWPDKERVELTKQRNWVLIDNADAGYEITYKGTVAQEKEMFADYARRRSHSLEWALRKWLKQPGVAIFYEGQSVAERKPAEQISILNENNDGITLWIDGKTHLPLRKAFSWRDPKTHDRIDEAEGYDNYRPVQGIMVPFSVIRYKNDQPTNQRFITSVAINKGLPDSMFDAKIGPPTAAKK